MLKRKIYESLLSWKNSKRRECLLLKGARQVGKTYIVREFGKKEYENFVEINFLEQKSLMSVFAGDISAEEIYKRLSANIPGLRIVPGKTLLFLDEIQRCPEARTALKFLAQDKRCDVIASGSLLGLSYGQDGDKDIRPVPSIPVGYERPIMMYPMDFEEFLWAYGYEDQAIQYLKGFYLNREKAPLEINNKFEDLVREYIVVGGMPEVVADFVTNKDFGRVQEIQNKILSSYIDDIAQHAKGVEKAKVRACYDSIPGQLAKENTKFMYSLVEKGGSGRKFEASIQWLSDSNLVNPCRNVSLPAIPLNAYEKGNEFKLYLSDTGLLMARYGFFAKQALLNGTLKGFAKGGIYENLIAQILTSKGYSLHYYKPNPNSEIEFVIEKDGSVIPVEVKAGNSPTKSLDSFLKEFEPPFGVKLIAGNVGVANKKLSIPHYLVMFL